MTRRPAEASGETARRGPANRADMRGRRTPSFRGPQGCGSITLRAAGRIETTIDRPARCLELLLRLANGAAVLGSIRPRTSRSQVKGPAIIRTRKTWWDRGARPNKRLLPSRARS